MGRGVQSDTGGSDLYKTDGGGTNTLSLSPTPENVSSKTILSLDFERKCLKISIIFHFMLGMN